MRDGVEVYDSTISSLKRFKEDVREVKEGAFPDDDHSYSVNEDEYEKFLGLVEKRKQM